jgi:hypothetical protein
MSLQSKIALLKEKADKYDKLQQNYTLLEENCKNSFKNLYNSLYEKNNIIIKLESQIDNKNNEYINEFTKAYNLHFADEYNKLKNIINEQKTQIEQLNTTVSYYSKLNVYSDMYNYNYKEQIFNTKINNLLIELKNMEKEKESLMDKVSVLIGEIDDLKGNSHYQSKQKNYEIDLLKKEVNKLEDYILQKDRIINNLMTSSNQNIISVLKNNLNQKYIENTLLKEENEKYKLLIEELEGIDLGQEIINIEKEEYENDIEYDEVDDEDEDEDEDEDDEDDEDEDDKEDEDIDNQNVYKYNIFNEWVKINKPKEEIIKYLSNFQNLEQIVIH